MYQYQNSGHELDDVMFRTLVCIGMAPWVLVLVTNVWTGEIFRVLHL